MMKRSAALFTGVLFIQMISAQESELILPSKIEREQIVEHKAFTLSYSSAYVVSSWVTYKVTKNNVITSDKVKAKYVADPAISTRSADKKDYKDSGYLMAQLVNYKDVMHIDGAEEETFYMTNIVPMKLAFHTHIWLKSDELVRLWSKEKGDLNVFAGPVTKEAPFPTIGTNKVAIPKNFFKVVYDPVNQEAIAFKFKNGISSGSLKSFSMSVEKLEELTGIDYFPELADDVKKKIKSEVNYDFWDFEIIDK